MKREMVSGDVVLGLLPAKKRGIGVGYQVLFSGSEKDICLERRTIKGMLNDLLKCERGISIKLNR